MGATRLDALLPLLRSAEDIAELEAAVRYPGASRKTAPVALAGGAAFALAFAVTRSVWASLFCGLLASFAGAVLTIGRDNRVRDVALRILDNRPELTPQEAANAARRELGLRQVRYPDRVK